MLLAKLKIKEDKVAGYLEIADKTDKAVEADESGMLHHTFDQDPEDALRFVWSEFYKNDDALLAHLANPAVGVYLEAHAELGTDFSVEFYRTVGDKVIEALKHNLVIAGFKVSEIAKYLLRRCFYLICNCNELFISKDRCDFYFISKASTPRLTPLPNF